jgi:hypothetical protein
LAQLRKGERKEKGAMSGNNTRVVLLRLYARVLRLHREKLPLPLRDLGDQYVREEFRSMWKLKEADLAKHHDEFSQQWENYTKSLSHTDAQQTPPLEGEGGMRNDQEGNATAAAAATVDSATTSAMESLGQRVSELNEEQKEQLKRLKTEIEDLTK